MRTRIQGLLIRYGTITIAAFFYGVGVSMALDPNGIVPGGITGIAMIVSRFIPISVGTIILLLNIPILGIGLWKFGFKFLISTIYATIVVSLFTNMLSLAPPITKTPLLAAFAGNVLIAFSLGIIFKCHATTGGMDIVVKLLRIKYPHMKTGTLFFMADVAVVAVSGVVFGNWDRVLYALIGVMIMETVFDAVLYGKDEARMMYIISAKSAEIANRILRDLSIGVTFLNGQGAYSKKETKVILCVVKKNQSPRVEDIVKEIDPQAFMIIGNATEIYGEGYKDIHAGRL